MASLSKMYDHIMRVGISVAIDALLTTGSSPGEEEKSGFWDLVAEYFTHE